MKQRVSIALAGLALTLLPTACGGGGHSRLAPGPPPKAIAVTFVDRAGQTAMALFIQGTRQGQFTLRLKTAGVFSGELRLPASPGSRIALHTTVPVHVWSIQGQPLPSSRLTLDGTVRPAVHGAQLSIRVARPSFSGELTTAQPRAADANAATAKVIRAIGDNDLQALARLLSPSVLGGRSAYAAARQFSAAGIRVTRITPHGRGHLGWLQSGYPTWIQAVTASALTPSGSRTTKTNLVMIEQQGKWWLLETAP